MSLVLRHPHSNAPLAQNNTPQGMPGGGGQAGLYADVQNFASMVNYMPYYTTLHDKVVVELSKELIDGLHQRRVCTMAFAASVAAYKEKTLAAQRERGARKRAKSDEAAAKTAERKDSLRSRK